jgi:hypothetical protein
MAVKLLNEDGIAVPNTFVEEWMTSNYKTCREKKSDFLLNLGRYRRGDSIQPDFKKVWKVARKLLSWVAIGLLAQDHLQAQFQLEEDDDDDDQVDEEEEGVETRLDTLEEVEVPALVTRASFVQTLTGMRGLEYLTDVLASLRVPTPA